MGKRKKKKLKKNIRKEDINKNLIEKTDIRNKKEKNSEDLINLYVDCSVAIILIYGVCTSFSTIYQVLIN